jgi:hypothetical protein
MGWLCSTHRETRNEYKVLLRNLEGKRSVGDIAVHGKMVLKLILINSV